MLAFFFVPALDRTAEILLADIDFASDILSFFTYANTKVALTVSVAVRLEISILQLKIKASWRY